MDGGTSGDFFLHLAAKGSTVNSHQAVRVVGNVVADSGQAGIELSRGGSGDVEGLDISGNRIFVEGTAAEGQVGISCVKH